jgi:6-phosphogluconolactonase
MPSAAEIRILNSLADLSQSAAAEFIALAVEAVRSKGRFCVALCGGSTPRGLYALLANQPQRSLPWEKIYFFWGDERHVPPDHPDSNYRMAFETLLSKVPIPSENIFRVHAEEMDADTAAREYEQTLTTFFHLQPGEFPRFDLMLLGMGPDGHTASLFPRTRALHEKTRLVVANRVETLKAYRITMTLPVLNNSAYVLFLVSGRDKANVLREVLERRTEELPASLVCPANGRLVWMVDREAASALPKQMGDGSRVANF